MKSSLEKLFERSESAEQGAFISWCALNERKYPGLNLIHAIPNGGNRDVITGANMKREGVKRGVCDLFLPVARGSFHGLYIEMKKRNGGTPSKWQREFIKAVQEQGYMATVCHGADEASAVVTNYYRMPVTSTAEERKEIA